MTGKRGKIMNIGSIINRLQITVCLASKIILFIYKTHQHLRSRIHFEKPKRSFIAKIRLQRI